MRYLILFVTLILAQALEVRAQQDPQFSQYMFNPLHYNPAYAGVEAGARITAVHRTQWLGFSTTFDGGGGNPNTEVLNFSMPLAKLRGGIGIELSNDNLGPQNNFKALASYGFNYKFNQSTISIGLRAGIFAQTIDYDQLRPVQPDDPLLVDKSGSATQIKPDMGAGIWFSAPKFYVGVAVNHLIRSQFDFGVAGQSSPLERNLTISAGYVAKAGYNFTLTPSALIKTDLNSYSFDLGLVGTYNQKMWGGVAFRQSEAAIVMLGYSFLKDNALKVGYSIDMIIKDREAKQPTSHELLITYVLPISNEPRKVIKTPRFN